MSVQHLNTWPRLGSDEPRRHPPGRVTLLRAVRRGTPTAIQILAAGGLAVLIAVLLGFDRPIGAPLFAITTLEFVCARHRRVLAVFMYGAGFGLAAAAVMAGYRTVGRIALDLIIGVLVAMLIAYLATPRNAERRIVDAAAPVLTNVTRNVRAIAEALRRGDVEAGRAAVYDLADTDRDLQRLNEVLAATRRAAAITLGSTARDLHAQSASAREIGYAVRNIRVMARHAWFDVLRSGQHVPAALPPMMESLADGVSLLRDELMLAGHLRMARSQLVSAARWIEVLREERLTMECAAVAANAHAAVLNLLIGTGTPVAQADAMLHA